MADKELNLPVIWVDLDETPIQMSNMFVSQFLPTGEFIVSLGQSSGPLLIGSEEEIEEQLTYTTHVAVRPIVRVSFTEETMKQFVGILQMNIERFQQAKQRGEQ